MTRTPPARTRAARPRGGAGTRLAVVLAGVAWSALVTAGAAHAAEPAPTADDSQNLSVTIPAPTKPPTTPPPPAPTTPPKPGGSPTPPATAPKPVTKPTGSTPAADDPAAPPEAVCTPTEPPVPTAPERAGETAATDKDVYLPGQQLTVTASGFPAGQQVQLVLFAEPAVVGTFTADAAGAVSAVVPIAEGTPAGRLTVQLAGWCEGVALAPVLVGGGSAAPAGEQGVPTWAWWAGGGVGVGGLGVGGWWVLRAMRAPADALVAVALR